MDDGQDLADALTFTATAQLLSAAMSDLSREVAVILTASRGLVERAKTTRPLLPRGNVIIPFPKPAPEAKSDDLQWMDRKARG